MAQKILKNNRSAFFCFLLIFMSFLLTSAGYFSWNYHLIDLDTTLNINLIAEVIAYIFQIAGLGLFMLASRFRPKLINRTLLIAAFLFYVILLIPSLLSENTALVLCAGYSANLIYGIIAGFYLAALTEKVSSKQRAVVFGTGYGISCFALWVLTLFGDLLRQHYVLILYALFAIISAGLYVHLDRIATETAQNGTKSGLSSEDAAAGMTESRLIVLAFCTVIFLSLVKNLGFAFPTADFGTSVNPELSRVFYGAGLIIAGVINDRSRKSGAILCLAALVIPFIMLTLSGASVPAMVLWSLNYFFFGFFSVYRVILFSDLSLRDGFVWLAAAGLFAGRIGDVLGTSIHLLFINTGYLLVIVAATFFIITVFLFFRLYQQIYAPAPAPQKSEQEKFEAFVSRYAFSQREREVLRLILKEKTNTEIASELFVSESTVKFHVHNILKKTGCKNRVALLEMYYK